MSAEDEFLRDLARRQAARYLAHTRPVAILLAGSAATGDADGFADTDLICYYDAIPPEAAFAAARAGWAGATGVEATPWHASGLGETATHDGVEVQVGHCPVATVERDIAAATEAFGIDAVLHKKVLGLLEGTPLHGADLLDSWRARLAAYPDGLALAMVEGHLRAVFPLWYYRDHLARRDAAIWQRHALAEAALHLLGALAGLNRRYFSATELKRTRALAATLHLAPPDLVARLEAALAADVATGIAGIEALAREVVALVARHLPGADTGVLRRAPGAREEPWSLPHP